MSCGYSKTTTLDQKAIGVREADMSIELIIVLAGGLVGAFFASLFLLLPSSDRAGNRHDDGAP